MERTGINYNRAIVNTLNGATLYAMNESIKVKSKATKAYVIDRKILADICAEEAKKEGAQIILGHRLTRNEIIKKATEYKVLIGADGAVSSTASAFRFPEMKEYVLTYKAEYTNALIEDKNSVGLYFDNSIAKRFFGWSIPYSSSTVELGIGTDSKYRRNSKAAFEQFAKMPKILDIIKNSQLVSGHASLIPLRPRKRSAIRNVLLVGDAAGQVKATTGGGIIFGVACAKVAAESIESYLTKGKSLDSYDSKWRKSYGLDLSLHRLLHKSYSSINGRRMDVLFKMIKLFGGEGFFSNYGDMDRPTAMLKSLILRKANP
jgi:flavin-dependent dehydrogenase